MLRKIHNGFVNRFAITKSKKFQCGVHQLVTRIQDLLDEVLESQLLRMTKKHLFQSEYFLHRVHCIYVTEGILMAHTEKNYHVNIAK